MNDSPFVEMPKILKENVEYFVKEPGARDTISMEEAPEYIYAIEEFAELIQAITKLARHKGSTSALAAEMAHLYITLANLQQMYDISTAMIQNALDEKMHEYDLKGSTEVISSADMLPDRLRIELSYEKINANPKNTIPAYMYVILRELRDECDANSSRISVYYKDANCINGTSLSYNMVIDIFKPVGPVVKKTILDHCCQLRDSYGWTLNIMKDV